MFYTITMNPALDYYLEPVSEEKGKTNRVRNERIVPGGKGFNVSMMLRTLGEETAAFGFTSGFSGAELRRLMEEKSVKSVFFDVRTGFTRINVKLLGETVTEYNGSGITLRDEDIEKLISEVSALDPEDWLIFSGKDANRTEDSKKTVADILREKKNPEERLVADVSGETLLSVLPLRPFLIKPNVDELSEAVGHPVSTDPEIRESAETLQKMGARNVLVSRGGDGAALLTESGEFYTAPAPEIPEDAVLNTVGAGDSLLAAFLHKVSRGASWEEALSFSVRIGTEAACTLGIPEKVLDEDALRE